MRVTCSSGVLLTAAWTLPLLTRAQSASRTATAAEYGRGVEIYQATGFPIARRDVIRMDGPQFDSTLMQQASDWAASLPHEQVHGIQLDPMGSLYVSAGQDALAKQQFATRLATPGLSPIDRAYTLLLAVQVFGAKAADTTRMRTALDYLRQLDALPASVVGAQYQGHVAVAEAFYNNGESASAATHLKQAFALVPVMSFERRNWLRFRFSFAMLADVLSGRPDGRAQIDSLTAWLRPYTQASPELIAKDPAYLWMSRANLAEYQKLVQMTSLLGRSAPPITAHYWLNTPVPTLASTDAPSAKVKTLADGKIRVLEYGHYGCPGCLGALPKMERLRKNVSKNVEVWFVSQEGDIWGARHCSPDEVVAHLTQFYVERKGYQLPMAIWIGARQSDVDGGSLIQESPMSQAFQFFGWPTFVVTDGQGRVRHIQFGYAEQPLMQSVQYLVAEAAHTS